MHLEPLYQVRFTTPERWSVELSGESGSEAQSFLVAEGRCEGSISGRFRAANFPRTRVDGTLLPDFRGVVETDDGAALLLTARVLPPRDASLAAALGDQEALRLGAARPGELDAPALRRGETHPVERLEAHG